jgi:hypothetical protein
MRLIGLRVTLLLVLIPDAPMQTLGSRRSGLWLYGTGEAVACRSSMAPICSSA